MDILIEKLLYSFGTLKFEHETSFYFPYIHCYFKDKSGRNERYRLISFTDLFAVVSRSHESRIRVKRRLAPSHTDFNLFCCCVRFFFQ